MNESVSINITPDGILISIPVAPGVSINTAINETTMNALCTQWIQTRKEIKQQLELVGGKNGHVRK